MTISYKIQKINSINNRQKYKTTGRSTHIVVICVWIFMLRGQIDVKFQSQFNVTNVSKINNDLYFNKATFVD